LCDSEDNADGMSMCSPLVPQVGSNTIVLILGTSDSDKKEISYGYDLRGAPKDVSSSDLIFDDSYIIKSTGILILDWIVTGC
jgi:hypothetical protein